MKTVAINSTLEQTKGSTSTFLSSHDNHIPQNVNNRGINKTFINVISCLGMAQRLSVVYEIHALS